MISSRPIQQLIPACTGKAAAVVMLWFGSPSHPASLAGYSSDDPVVIAGQIDTMKARGVDFAILCLQGPDVTPINWKAARQWKIQCELKKFSFMLMLDVACIKFKTPKPEPTLEVKRIIGLCTEFFASPNYMRWSDGRFLVMEFGLETEGVDFVAVAATYPGIALICRNVSRLGSAGRYAWPGSRGLAYMKEFYAASTTDKDKIVVGALLKGFDASQSSWGIGKPVVDERNGQTWLDSAAMTNAYAVAGNRLDFELIVWNDYEEHTAMEPGALTDLKVTGNTAALASGLDLKPFLAV